MINMIAAVGRRGELGFNGHLPWPKNLPDLALFQMLTTNAVVIVGYLTHPSVKHVDGTYGRDVIVDIPDMPPIETIGWLQARYGYDREVWIAGGAKTYRKWAPHIDGAKVISLIDWTGVADCFFPFDAFNMEIRNDKHV